MLGRSLDAASGWPGVSPGSIGAERVGFGSLSIVGAGSVGFAGIEWSAGRSKSGLGSSAAGGPIGHVAVVRDEIRRLERHRGGPRDARRDDIGTSAGPGP